MLTRRSLLGIGVTALGGLSAGELAACQTPVVGEAPLAKGQLGVAAIAVDAYYAYWTLASGEVRRVSLDGGAVETLAQGKAGPSSIALDDTHVYWSAGDGTVARVAKKGGAVSVIAVANAVGDVAVDEVNVYFVAGTSVLSVAKDASVSTAPDTLAASQIAPRSLFVRGGVVWASEGDAKTPNGAISQVAVKGGAPVALVTQVSPHVLAASPTRLAWTEVGQGLVRTAGLDGSSLLGSSILDVATVDPTVRTERTGQPELLDTIVTNDEHAFFTSSQGVVRKVALSSGATPEVLVEGAIGRVALALDATTLYVANAGDGAILALPLG